MSPSTRGQAFNRLASVTLSWISNRNFWIALLVIVAAIISGHRLLLGKQFLEDWGIYTHYNNFAIFKSSFFHLVQGKDLYQLHLADHFDYYKYSPTFALLMAPFAILPDGPGLFFWNLLNALALFFAMWYVPLPSDRARGAAIAVLFIELITSLQNSQSNGLVAGLLIGAFAIAERSRQGAASFCVVLNAFVKLFGAASYTMFLFYPGKGRVAVWSLGWVAALLFAPLVVVGPEQLMSLYRSWMQLLANDHSASWGLSAGGWLHAWFGFEPHKMGLLVAGTLLLLTPLIRVKAYGSLRFRTGFVAALLLWTVLFNHKAESPTFVIAMAGVALWFFSAPRRMGDHLLLLLAILLTEISTTDLFPPEVRRTVIRPYALKVLPCIVIWLRILWELWRITPGKNEQRVKPCPEAVG
ncbi:MAG: DUF2029 domain-containing protein [Saprospiraceae bacterium]|nr:DUF2029 domain-containing protein [Saprospiraceae bacterium]